ncbi:type II secretion system inner membrane protein GspF [Granulosicoccaceae sp. 1_MG-2023]|nr:type II secretion system inner membrane protein GspF [Granulosicoccaceae sp. 1_MG-2023]
MPAFEYTALEPGGRETRGIMEGDNPRQIRDRLREMKLIPVDVEETRSKSKNSKKSNAGDKSRKTTRLKASDLALVTRQLATLVSSGTPVPDAMEAVSRQTERPVVKSLMLSVRSSIQEGKSLAQALSAYPRAFPEIYTATVQAGNESGHLAPVLERLADYTEERQVMRQTITKALMYPTVLIFASILIVALLLAYVVPQVTEVFADMNQELPTLTKVIIGLSDYIKTWGLLTAAVFVGLVFLFKRAMRFDGFHTRVHALLLKLPLIGKLMRGMNTAQFARTLSILIASGVETLHALNIAAQVVSNRPMREAVTQAAGKVREGAKLASALERTGYFPPLLVHLIASGQNSGQLDKMLDKAATHQEREFNATIGMVLAVFEPAIILLMGGVVMAIVAGILMPIFEMNNMVTA